MTATTAQTRAVLEWLAMLDQVEATIVRSVIFTDGAELAAPTDDEASDSKRLTSRLDRRIRKLGERVAEAERSADAVCAELAGAEDELRRWVDQVHGISARLNTIRQAA